MKYRGYLKAHVQKIIPQLVCLTKKYKYYQCKHQSILKNVWGEIIKKIGVILVLAMAMLSVPVMAQGIAGNGGVDILGRDGNGGIFETDGSAFRFPDREDTNVDDLTVGNDKALAFGNIWQKTPLATATNNLEIKKNQDSGLNTCCNATKQNADGSYEEGCQDCCIKVNIDQIKVGNREAMAFGFASATNNVKIVANQQ
jgi:hypothetical protein